MKLFLNDNDTLSLFSCTVYKIKNSYFYVHILSKCCTLVKLIVLLQLQNGDRGIVRGLDSPVYVTKVHGTYIHIAFMDCTILCVIKLVV